MRDEECDEYNYLDHSVSQPGPVAQLVERRYSNPEVVGSNPVRVKDFSFILVLISNFFFQGLWPGGNYGGQYCSLLGLIAIASSCQLSNLSSLVHSSLLSSKNYIEFLVLFDITFPKDFGESKAKLPQKCCHFTVELFNLANARDFPELASVFQ